MTAPLPDQTPMDLLVGRTVGPYVLEELLGEGGFAGVFLSTHHVLGRPFRKVALKLSRATGMTEETVSSLFDDAFLLAEAMDSITDAETRLHLVHVYDVGLTGDGRAYLTMEYVKGTTLADRFARQKKLDAVQLTRWITQIATALRALHRQGVVHRDLKPDNVLLGVDNAVRLVDFGLAARLVDLGHVPGVAGTLTYMAPETIQGRSVPASDIYSLGLLMFEGLTGQQPFRDLLPPPDLPDDQHGSWLYRAKRNRPAPRVSALSNTVTPKLEAIIQRCLEFEHGDRFGDADEFLEALRAPERKSAKAARKVKDKPTSTNLVAARKAFEDELASGSLTGRQRLDLLRQLATTLESLGEHAAAAKRLAQAWQLTESSALLRDTADRVALLTLVAAFYRRAGNEFQARRYEALRAHEPGGHR